MLTVFAFCWHDNNSYRTVASGHGAFELCLPSLGILYQNRMLWCENIHRTPRTSRVWGEEDQIGHRGQDVSGRRPATLCPLDGVCTIAS